VWGKCAVYTPMGSFDLVAPFPKILFFPLPPLHARGSLPQHRLRAREWALPPSLWPPDSACCDSTGSPSRQSLHKNLIPWDFCCELRAGGAGLLAVPALHVWQFVQEFLSKGGS
jgi:hypothetical protein